MKALKWLKGRKVKKFEHLSFDQEDQQKVTAVLEVHLHSCIVHRVESVEIDVAKGEMTVKGAFDVSRKAEKVVKVVSSEIETTEIVENMLI
ncbi:hypothetical protein L484_017464 [Morus notabilis]|uniref:Uncharacterized protein n=1 Tax=Morus notabilis TaxID=981085 RepID=W9QTT3_9ROSA|nr:hypothetical protein L484_017464 [Morus notabilis]